MQLISYCEPRNVMLVHGEAVKMEFLKEKIKQEFGIDCFMPANGETATIKTPITIQGIIVLTVQPFLEKLRKRVYILGFFSLRII